MTGLPDGPIELGAVGLSVANLERSLEFYCGVIGMTVLERADREATLGVGARRLLVLEERRGAVRDAEAADLFHFALLLPSRHALGQQLDHMLESGAQLTGAADHHVSEALYLDDPDGHGIELYRDRPSDGWYVDGRVRLTNEPLDLDHLRQEADRWQGLDSGTVMGHVHLQTFDLGLARRFYEGELGFEVTEAWPHATFLSVGGYHHHLALNDWRGKRRPAVPDTGIGLLWYEIRVPAPFELAELPGRMDEDALVVTDPNGIPIRFVSA